MTNWLMIYVLMVTAVAVVLAAFAAPWPINLLFWALLPVFGAVMISFVSSK